MAKRSKTTRKRSAPAPSLSRAAELPAERQVRQLAAQIKAHHLRLFKQSMPRTAAQAGYAARRRGASQGRFDQPWGASTTVRGGSVGARWDQGQMADRAVRAFEENVVARSLLQTETDYVVADGFEFQPRSGDPAWNREAKERHWRFMETADVSGLRTGAQLFRESWLGPRRDGDGAFLKVIDDAGRPRLQYVARDQIANPYGPKTVEGVEFDRRRTFDGVECDDAGRPARFWIRSTDQDGRQAFEPVGADELVYLAHLARPSDVRGTTVMATIFGLLDQLDSYLDAVTKAAIMAAIFGLIERRKNPGAALSPLDTVVNAQGLQQKAVTYENGMLKVIGSEDGVFQVQAQQPMQQTPDFIRALFRIICLAFDMPLEIGQKDVSQVNFSGGRIGLLGFYRSCRIKQTWLKNRCWYPTTSWWLSVERRRQQLGYPDAFKTPFPADWDNFELHGREYEANNRLEEAQADLLEFSMGRPIQDIRSERGQNYEEDRLRWKSHLDWCRENGLPIVLSTVTRDAVGKVTAVDADGNPVGGQDMPLNGVQITAAMDVLAKVAERTIPADAAVEMLTRLGIAADRARAIVAAAQANRTGISASDRDFQRQVLLKLLDVQGAKQAVYNSTDVEDLITQTGLPPEKRADGEVLEVPFLPVVADSGPLVSGGVVKDSAGDIVGGDVLPAAKPATGPGDNAVASPSDAPPASTPKDNPS